VTILSTIAPCQIFKLRHNNILINKLLNAVSAASTEAALQHQRRAYNSALPAHAVPQRGCVGRHLANINEMRISGSDSYALLFLFSFFSILITADVTCGGMVWRPEAVLETKKIRFRSSLSFQQRAEGGEHLYTLIHNGSWLESAISDCG